MQRLPAVLFYPLVSVVTTLIYYDLRVRKEGVRPRDDGEGTGRTGPGAGRVMAAGIELRPRSTSEIVDAAVELVRGHYLGVRDDRGHHLGAGDRLRPGAVRRDDGERAGAT